MKPSLKPVNINTIKKIWHTKLTKNFEEDKEYFNLYIDSPFCTFPKCKFCTFLPEIINNKEDVDLKNRYYDKILIESIQEFKGILKLRKPDSAYFGGGSSSLMTLKQMENIFSELQKHCDFKKIKEKHFEFNPNQVTKKKIDLLNKWNFSNVTMGIQTFNQDVLKFNNRTNPPLEKIKDIFRLFEDAKYEYDMDLMAFIYKDNLDEDMAILKKDLEIAMKILKPLRITIFPNYKAIPNPEQYPKHRKEVFTKITALRKTLKEFNNKEYVIWIKNPEEVTNQNYQINYYFIKKDHLPTFKYNCTGWKEKNFRKYILKQNVLAFGGYGDRKPYSYISDKFCYNIISIAGMRIFELVYADITY